MPTKKVAILIDGGWFSPVLGNQLTPKVKWPTAQQVYDNTLKILEPNEDLLKIYYYDSLPYDKTATNPIDKTTIDYSKTPGFTHRNSFFRDLGNQNYIALRRGDMKFRGWKLSKGFQKQLSQGKVVSKALTGNDIDPDLQQKGVDMRIGIDVATLALKHQVDRIILFTGDADMIPAIKLARREGIQVVLVRIGNKKLVYELIEDCDIFRTLDLSKPTPVLP
jgi:uncharacterized protein (TIGR00288 family)